MKDEKIKIYTELLENLKKTNKETKEMIKILTRVIKKLEEEGEICTSLKEN
ncbi:hypothetical protein [Sigmofec virus UA08Rod_5306]|uniref:Uncharacterized protein n=1 Tax=Sigmofec virus UA08Rod_5306 TaxID=2929417 RepID=A0A976N1E8_9VIRU|nr:hypothetical protein [Sigmofec virus UA08Rod_5306]